MQNYLYPWQYLAWESLQKLRDRLPHAILLYGAAGTGKSEFASLLAQSLLCELPATNGQPCTACASCGWFVQYSHPDFRRVRPEALDDEAGDGDGDGNTEAETKKVVKSSKTPSKDIRIEQVRALANFMHLSTHRNGHRVVLLYPAESLNTASANALLKTLEEPPPRTVILLVSNRIDRLLPTVLSRCRKFAMPTPVRAEALSWLQAQQVADADVWLDAQGGAPLAALAQSQAGGRAELDAFLEQLAHPGSDTALVMAEKFQKHPMPDVVSWMQRWLYDMFSCKMTGRIRFYPRYRRQLTVLAARAEVHALMAGLQGVVQRRAIAEHPLAPKLFIEDMLLEYAQIFP